MPTPRHSIPCIEPLFPYPGEWSGSAVDAAPSWVQHSAPGRWSTCYDMLRFPVSTEILRAWFSAQLAIEAVSTSVSLWSLGHGSNAGHSSGVAQGQRSLNRCSGRDFQHEVFAPTATAAFHSQTVAAGMLLQQRPTRRVLSCATAKLLRDEAESMVPNIDPEQVRKLAGWGLTQNDRASFVGWSQSLLSLGF